MKQTQRHFGPVLRKRLGRLAVGIAILGIVLGSPDKPAAEGAPTIDTIAKQVYLLDMSTGAVLLQKDAHTPMPPASMSKLMTLYMVFERLRDGRLKLEDTFPVSAKAWRKG